MHILRWLMRLTLGKRQPPFEGRLTVSGLQDRVEIRRDRMGIPSIEARNEFDAAWGIGFCHGQDRSFQLELLRRIGRGILSEWVGRRALSLDKLSRRLGFFRASVKQWEACDKKVHDLLEAYCAGINDANQQQQRAHEFRLLGGKPSPWTGLDVLAFLKLMSFRLPSNWDVELARWYVLQTDGPQALAKLDPAGDYSGHYTQSKVAATLASDAVQQSMNLFQSELADWQELLGRGGGSNNWVIGPELTESGFPLLAGDPHLAPAIPAPWYLVHVSTPEGVLVGATFVGSPAVVIGHNGHACWSVTAGLTDNTDLFLEKFGPSETTLEPTGEEVPLILHEEVIAVKNEPSVLEICRETARGPIILQQEEMAVSLKALWLEPRPIKGFLEATSKKTFHEFRAPFAQWPVLPLNIVYADRLGEIGYFLCGEIPRRKTGIGLFPMPAWLAQVGWEKEHVDFSQMPWTTNPQCHFLASANYYPPVASPVFLGHDFVEGYRSRRIEQLLATSEEPWNVTKCLQMQKDVYSLAWEELKSHILVQPPHDAEARIAWDLLEGWDGHLDAASSAATIFTLLWTELVKKLCRDHAPRSWRVLLGESAGFGQGNLFADRRQAHLISWFKQLSAEEKILGQQSITTILIESVRWLRQHAGPSPEWWSWGNLRPLILKHPLFGSVKGLRSFFNRGPFPCGGDSNTISQAGVLPLSPLAPTHNMANLRVVFDTQDWSKSRFVLCGGQSGLPTSRHYDDQLDYWLQGEGLPIASNRQESLAMAEQTLILDPAPREAQSAD